MVEQAQRWQHVPLSCNLHLLALSDVNFHTAVLCCSSFSGLHFQMVPPMTAATASAIVNLCKLKKNKCAPPTRSSVWLPFTEASAQVSKLPLHLLNNSVSRLCANIDNCLITRRRVTCFYLRDDNSLRMWRGRSRGAPRIECHSAPRPWRKKIPVISLRHLIPNSRRDSTMRRRSCSLRVLVGEATWNFQGCFHYSEGEK